MKAAGSKRVVLAGGNGFVGRCLTSTLLREGFDVVVLSRSPQLHRDAVTQVAWDGKTHGPWADLLEGAAAVINLAGKNVNCRYTKKNLTELNNSRVDSVHAIGRAISQCKRPPGVWVQASTTAIYGDAGERLCDEQSPHGRGVPVETAAMWERAFAENPTPHTRRVLMRISFALSSRGGVLQTLTNLTRCFLGGTVGSGRQYISWIHRRDLNRMFLWAIQRDGFAGVFNAASPHPVTNRQFMGELRKALRRPWSPPTPTWLVHVGSFFMRTEPVLALAGRRAPPARFSQLGFEFEFPHLRGALTDLFG